MALSCRNPFTAPFGSFVRPGDMAVKPSNETPFVICRKSAKSAASLVKKPHLLGRPVPGSSYHTRAMRSCRISGFWVLVFTVSCVLGRAEDWPQWLGLERSSIWKETGIVETFPKEGPPIQWRTAIGAGYAGPVVSQGRIYVMDRPGSGTNGTPGTTERVLCLRESDAKVLWKHEYGCRYSISYPAGPRVSPLWHEEKLYTLGAEGNLFCLDANTGKPVWSKEFKKDFNIKAPMWGFASHPLLEDHALICLVGGDRTTVVAFDKDTGKELWRSLSADEPGYSSPIMIDAGGKRQLIIFHPQAVNSLDPGTGDVFWSVPFKCDTGLCVATPRRLDDRLFFTSFYNGSLMLRLNPSKPAVTEEWRSPRGNEQKTTHLNAILCTPFLEDGYIYGVCSYGQLRCLKAATGERVWETFEATTSGGPVRWANAFLIKNGKRFFLFNEKGDLIIARLSPKGYEEISRAHLLDPLNKDCGRPVVWSHPAFANRRMYARNDKEIICADLAQKP